MFLRSFLFRASPRARIQSSRWSDDCGEEVERLHPSHPVVAGDWGPSETSPGEAVPRKFSEAGVAVQPEPPPCRSPGHRPPSAPPTLAGSGFLWPRRLADRAAVCARRAPRSVQAFPIGTRTGAGAGMADTLPGPLGREKARTGNVLARTPCSLGDPSQQGLAPTCPRARGEAGAFCEGCGPGTCRVRGTSPPHV